MSSVLPVALSPVGVRGMKYLNRQKFLRNVVVPALRVWDKKVSKVILICKPFILKLENFKPVQRLNDKCKAKRTLIFLNPEKINKWTDFSESDRKFFDTLGLTENNFDSREIQLTYENYKYDQIFKAVLPEGEETVSGFSQIGHLLHLNLRPHLLDYKRLIGQVLLDKIKTCNTVVNKTDTIDTTYRNFNMEVIAGDEDFIVITKENGCNFQFDFSKVYWNPRLATEHERIINLFKPGDVLFDVFCGVGPFSVPAACRKCITFANDLNPESYKWLDWNAKQNKVIMKLFKSYNLDGKDFICNILKDYLINLCKGTESLKEDAKIHITMNLPAMAIEFLKYFKGLVTEKSLADKLNCEIVVYVYCFAVGDEPSKAAEQMVKENIGNDILKDISIFNVRNVSPKKEMMRVTFKLTKNIIFGLDQEELGHCEPPLKKLCVDEKK